METKKFGADCQLGGGYIIISDTEFCWKPVIGNNGSIEIPIGDIISCRKKGLFIYVGIKYSDEMMGFYTWKGNKIIQALKEANPSIVEL